MRRDGRNNDEIRPVGIGLNIIENAGGSVLFSMGKTSVICTAMLEKGTPEFLKRTNKGWLTAEYAMLPASTPNRKKRETLTPDGRSTEIRRLIGRTLRSVCDFENMGEYTFYIDCDVINADGGTRTASINGAMIALALCADRGVKEGIIINNPVKQFVAAVSVGIYDDEILTDLCYAEDSNAIADMNFAAVENGDICEIQMCGEKRPVTNEEFMQLLSAARSATTEIIDLLKNTIEAEGIKIG